MEKPSIKSLTQEVEHLKAEILSLKESKNTSFLDSITEEQKEQAMAVVEGILEEQTLNVVNAVQGSQLFPAFLSLAPLCLDDDNQYSEELHLGFFDRLSKVFDENISDEGPEIPESEEE